MGGKSGSGEMYVVDYRISMHLGICIGPVDQIIDMKIGDKRVHFNTVTSNSARRIQNENLFGGPKKGGGVDGIAWFLLGGLNQKLNGYLADKYGRTADAMTGYRGIASVFLTSAIPEDSEEESNDPDWFWPSVIRVRDAYEKASGDGNQGFTIGSNNPVVPDVDVTVGCYYRSLADGLHAIDSYGNTLLGGFLEDVSGGGQGLDANPAHIIYECLTNTNFGIGYPANQVNKQSFLDASQTLYDEKFGLSYQWMTSTPVEQFVNEVLETIGANMSFDLATGQWELKLLRDDYDPSYLPVIYPGNANLTSFQRKGWGETINEIILTWSNPRNEEDETVTMHDNTNLAIQGATVSDSSKNFPGIRNGSLALKVAERELRQASAPLAAAEVEVDRSLWKLKPGDVARFSWPEYGITNPIVMRVLKTNYGTRGSPSVKLSLLEDIFSFGVSLTEVQPDIGTSPDQEPIDPPYFMVSSVPFFLYANAVGDNTAALSEFPETRSWLLCHSGLKDIRSIDVMSLEQLGEEVTEYEDVTTIDETFRFELDGPLAISRFTSVIPITPQQRARLAVGMYLLICPQGSRTNQEIARIVAKTSTTITVRRGLLDTIPKDWDAGTPVWALRRKTNMIDGTPRSAGETTIYKFLPITSLGRLPEPDATARTVTLPSRLQLPLRPANTRLDGNDITMVTEIAPTEDVTATWSNRNRLTETAVALHWSAGNTAPEDGQTTRIVIRDGTNSSTITAINDLTGTSRLITAAELGDPIAGEDRFIRFISRRDGFSSFQYAEMKLEIR